MALTSACTNCAELLERGPVGDVAVSRDHDVHIVKAFGGCRQRLGILDPAAAVARVHERRALVGEHVAGVHRPQRGKHDEGVAVRMSPAEVVQVDLVVSAQQRRLVLERLLGKIRLRGLGLERGHLLHVRLRVFLRDHVHGCREFRVRADVIAVRMRVDDHRHRLGRDGLDLIEDRLSPPGQLGIDDDDAVCRDEGGRVAAATNDHVQVVLDLLELRHILLTRRHRRRRHDERADSDDGRQNRSTTHVHAPPPMKKTRCTNQTNPAAATTTDPA